MAFVLVSVTGPLALSRVKVRMVVTVLVTDPVLVSKTVPVTTLPVVAVLLLTDATAFRSTSTVTVNVADTVAGVSSALLAVQVTVVVPTANVDPDAGAQLTVAAGESPASSTALGEVYVTTAPLVSVASSVMPAGAPVRARSASIAVPLSGHDWLPPRPLSVTTTAPERS